MKVHLIAGARPNFIKIAPIIEAIRAQQSKGNNIDYRLIHTGQHFDEKMSQSFFTDLLIPEPHVNLNCGGGSQSEQTAAIMVAYEKELIKNPADFVLVVGDVTSTMACSIVAKKLHTKVIHVEAGIRSFDLTMPEEINRIVTDSLSDYFFTTTEWAGQNLLNAGKNKEQIFFVGNVMIDTLFSNMGRFQKPIIWDEHNLCKNEYLILTLHRPSNVDDIEKLIHILTTIIQNTNDYPIVFPVHPRTKKVLEGIEDNHFMSSIIKTPPLGYLEFNYLVQNAKAVITDSGGITEEASTMGIPCLTLRDSTERPETVECGTNELIGVNPQNLIPYFDKLFSAQWKPHKSIPLWDGQAAKRIVDILLNLK
jgi:UDP-N-acetylglucosamine 2-epimerase (non-hydrolysing)